jgi:hypothetical protein
MTEILGSLAGEAVEFSPLNIIQIGCRAYLASYPISTAEGVFPGCKPA